MRYLVFICLSLVFGVYSCTSPKELLYDYNLNVDFDSYETYVLCTDDMMVVNLDHPKLDNVEVRQIIADAIALEMEERNHRSNVFKPQLQAGFMIAINEKTSKFNNCEHSRELDYWENCDIHNETYQQETLITYVANFETNEILWQASLPCDLKKHRTDLNPYILELVGKLYSTYPKEASPKAL